VTVTASTSGCRDRDTLKRRLFRTARFPTEQIHKLDMEKFHRPDNDPLAKAMLWALVALYLSREPKRWVENAQSTHLGGAML